MYDGKREDVWIDANNDEDKGATLKTGCSILAFLASVVVVDDDDDNDDRWRHW